MQRRILTLLSLALMLALVAGCGGGKLTTRAASQKLKPVEALPEREQSQMPVNLSIKIANVADATSSYGNFVELFINGKAIAPENPENNLKSTYRYNLRLQPGIYEVKAKYHVIGFWKERVYEIGTDEPVKVLPGQRTELSINLDKDSRGFLRQKKNQFTIRYADLDVPQRVVLQRVAPQKEVGVDKKPEIIEVRPKTEAPIMPRTAAEGVTLQINTVPVGADIYVDDRFVGQSPVRVVVRRDQGHVIQIASEGYREHLKVLDAGELKGKNDLQIIVRLEKEQ